MPPSRGGAGEFGALSKKGSLPQLGDISGWVGGSKSKLSLACDVGREIWPGIRLGCSEQESVTAGVVLNRLCSVDCSPILSCSALLPPSRFSWLGVLFNWDWEGEDWLCLDSSFLSTPLLQMTSFNVVTDIGYQQVVSK